MVGATHRTALAGLALLDMAMAGLSPQYCSSWNTGSDFSTVFNIYQSAGTCSQTCRDSYAFAVVQGKDCWCTNYAPPPSQQQDTSSCSVGCPGYPADSCGNPGEGLYGYIPLDIAPSGTAGDSTASPAPQSTSAPSPTSQPSPTSDPPTSSDPPPTTSSSPSPTPDTSTTTTTSSTPPPPPSSSSDAPYSSSSSSSSSPTSTRQTTPIAPIIRTSVITRSGSVVTQTVTSTPTSLPNGGLPANTELERKGLSNGAVAGAVVGSLLGFAALVLAGFLLWRRRKSDDAERQNGTPRPKRTTSVLSRTGLLSRGRPQSMAEMAYDQDNFNGGNSVRHSVMFGAGATVEPSSPLEGSQGDGSERRHSRPLVYDQRLNPSALFANAEANGSRVSMQDQQDYSRPLGVANPDTRASFDSR